jgi:hypothetical protein
LFGDPKKSVHPAVNERRAALHSTDRSCLLTFGSPCDNRTGWWAEDMDKPDAGSIADYRSTTITVHRSAPASISFQPRRLRDSRIAATASVKVTPPWWSPMTEPDGSFRAASAVGTLRMMMSKTGAGAELAIVAPHRGELHCLSTRRDPQPLARSNGLLFFHAASECPSLVAPAVSASIVRRRASSRSRLLRAAVASPLRARPMVRAQRVTA